MTRIRTFYDRYAPLLIVVCLLVATIGVIIGTSATFTSGALVNCLRRHASATAESSKAVREATVTRDVAAADFSVALNTEGEAFLAFVKKLARGRVDGPEDIGRLRATLAGRAAAARALDAAQAELDQVRRDNPVPDPPAVFCKLGEAS